MQIVQIREVLGLVGVRVGVGKQELPVQLRLVGQRRDEDCDFPVRPLNNPVPPGLNIQEHRRPRSEVERDVIAKCSVRCNGHLAMPSPADQVCHADRHEIRIQGITRAAVQAIAQNPRHIVHVRNAEDVCRFRPERWHVLYSTRFRVPNQALTPEDSADDLQFSPSEFGAEGGFVDRGLRASVSAGRDGRPGRIPPSTELVAHSTTKG